MYARSLRRDGSDRRGLATLSPAEIRRKGMGALLQTPSIIDAAHPG